MILLGGNPEKLTWESCLCFPRCPATVGPAVRGGAASVGPDSWVAVGPRDPAGLLGSSCEDDQPWCLTFGAVWYTECLCNTHEKQNQYGISYIHPLSIYVYPVTHAQWNRTNKIAVSVSIYISSHICLSFTSLLSVHMYISFYIHKISLSFALYIDTDPCLSLSIDRSIDLIYYLSIEREI